MEPKKYWWMSYIIEGIYYEAVTDIHPFTHKKKLLSWNLIDVTEYNLWLELNNKQ